jgi:peptide chain release factor 1
MADLDDRLVELARQYDQVQAQLADPAVTSDPDAIRRLGQELSRLEPVVEAHRALIETHRELAGAREMRDGEADDELQAMARDEVTRLEADEARQIEELKLLLLPRDPADDGSRRGRGGAVRQRAPPDVRPLRPDPPLQGRGHEPP